MQRSVDEPQERGGARVYLRSHWAPALLAAVIAVHLVMMASLFFGYLNPLFNDSDQNPQGIDFFAIYQAGHNALHHHSVYALDLNDTSTTPHHSPYRYLPIFAYAFGAPANAVPPWWAYWGWVAFSELLLVINAYATWRLAGRGAPALVAAAFWFPFTPFYLEQYMGQFSFLMATLLFYMAFAIVNGRRAAGGALWMASLLVKSNSAVLAPVLLRLRSWKTIVAGAASVFVTSAPYFLWRRHDLYTFYDANISSMVGKSDYLFHGGARFFQYFPGDLGAVALLRNAILAFDTTRSGVPAAYAVVLIAIVVGISLAATFLGAERSFIELLAIWMSVYFLTYGAWEHHYVMYLPVLVLLFAFAERYRAVTLAAYTCIALPTPYWFMEHVFNSGPLPAAGSFVSHQEVWPAWGVLLHHAVKPLAVATLWGVLCASRLRRRRSSGISESCMWPSDATGRT